METEEIKEQPPCNNTTVSEYKPSLRTKSKYLPMFDTRGVPTPITGTRIINHDTLFTILVQSSPTEPKIAKELEEETPVPNKNKLKRMFEKLNSYGLQFPIPLCQNIKTKLFLIDENKKVLNYNPSNTTTPFNISNNEQKVIPEKIVQNITPTHTTDDMIRTDCLLTEQNPILSENKVGSESDQSNSLICSNSGNDEVIQENFSLIDLTKYMTSNCMKKDKISFSDRNLPLETIIKLPQELYLKHITTIKKDNSPKCYPLSIFIMHVEFDDNYGNHYSKSTPPFIIIPSITDPKIRDPNYFLDVEDCLSKIDPLKNLSDSKKCTVIEYIEPKKIIPNNTTSKVTWSVTLNDNNNNSKSFNDGFDDHLSSTKKKSNKRKTPDTNPSTSFDQYNFSQLNLPHTESSFVSMFYYDAINLQKKTQKYMKNIKDWCSSISAEHKNFEAKYKSLSSNQNNNNNNDENNENIDTSVSNDEESDNNPSDDEYLASNEPDSREENDPKKNDPIVVDDDKEIEYVETHSNSDESSEELSYHSDSESDKNKNKNKTKSTSTTSKKKSIKSSHNSSDSNHTSPSIAIKTNNKVHTSDSLNENEPYPLEKNAKKVKSKKN
jgi:hypothetical protein